MTAKIRTKTYYFRVGEIKISIEVPKDYECSEYSPHEEALIFSVKDHLVLAAHRGVLINAALG